jgi:hypothetical protein
LLLLVLLLLVLLPIGLQRQARHIQLAQQLRRRMNGGARRIRSPLPDGIATFVVLYLAGISLIAFRRLVELVRHNSSTTRGNDSKRRKNRKAASSRMIGYER